MIGGLHNNIYAEVAAMFPRLSGGVAVYAHEAWKRYTTFVGPIAAVGYWLGWSVVLALNSVIVGGLLIGEFWSDATWGTTHNELILGIDFDASPAIWVGAVIIIGIWVANVFGVRPAVWTGYVTGACLLVPARRRHLPALHHGRLRARPTCTTTSTGARPAPPAGSS